MTSVEEPPAALHRADGLTYHIAEDRHSEAMARLLAGCFVHEPMGAALGLTGTELEAFVWQFIPECTGKGLSVIAVPEQGREVLAGVFINRDFKAPLPVGVPASFPRWAPIFAAVGQVDEEYEAQRPDLQPGQALDLWMVGVDRRFARRGVARTLFRLSAELARRQGFERCVTECTGAFSQRAALEAGFCERACVSYRDFVYDGRAVFASIPEPHVKVALYERIFG